MGYLIIAAQLFVSLSLLIVLHEFGHFLPARLFKTRVEKFFLFFDYKFALFKKKIGETVYGIGWIPLGGYVKISGMIDESMDKEQMKLPPQPHEFRSKPAWQRLIIMLGGVTVNFILGFFIFGMVLFTWGEQYIATNSIKDGIYVDSLGFELGLRDGDYILAIGDKPFDKFNSRVLIREAMIYDARWIKLIRKGEEIRIPIREDMVKQLVKAENRNKLIFSYRIPFIIESVVDKGPAAMAGLKPGDKIIGFNTMETPFVHEVREALKDLKGQQAIIKFDRGGNIAQAAITPDEKGFIQANYVLPGLVTHSFGFGEAMVEGTRKGYRFLADNVIAFGQMFKGKISSEDSLGGFGTFASLFPTTWNWQIFWRNTAIISLILAFMNLLPIPALDGGHVMFLLYEMVTGRKPNEKVMEYATLAGIVLLLGLLLYANWLDIKRFLL